MKLTIDKIKKELGHKRLSQKELANIIGVTDRTMTRWLTGRVDIKSHQQEKIANALGLTDEETISDENYDAIINSQSPRKRVSVMLNTKSINEYHYVEKQFNIDRNQLAEMAPQLLIALSKVSLDYMKSELAEIDNLSKQGYEVGFRHPVHKEKHQWMIKAVEESNPFRRIRIAPPLHMFNESLKKLLGFRGLRGAFAEQFSNHFNFLDEELAEYISHCISRGILNLANIPSDLWKEENKSELIETVTEELVSQFEVLLSSDGPDDIADKSFSFFTILQGLKKIKSSKDTSAKTKETASSVHALIEEQIKKHGWEDDSDFF